MNKIVLFCFVLSYGQVFSQARLKKADRLYESYAYKEAATTYDAYLKEDADADDATVLRAGDAYYFTHDMRKASTYYGKVYDKASSLEEPHLSRYVRSLRGIREYDKSDDIYLKHLQGTNDRTAIRRFKEQQRVFDSILASEKPDRFTIKNLDVNTSYSDFGAVRYGDKVVFSSARPGGAKELYPWNEQPYLSLFVASKNVSGDLGSPKLLSSNINSNFHDATVAFSPDMKTIYFTSNNLDGKKLVLDTERKNHFKLYQADVEDGEITDVKELFFNSDDYSVGHPAVSPDGKYLFFASDMPNGYGEADIYYCEIHEDGMVSTPKNAGEKINTSGNDFFPFLIDSTLYFSSNGHLGFGGLDLFESSFSEKDGFSNPKNLGKEVNTPYDDFAMIFNDDHETGYFSSNRPDGKGDDDLYYFHRAPLPCDQIVYGNVRDKESEERLAEATITIMDALDNPIDTVETDEDGNYEIEIPCDEDISVMATLEDYVSKTIDTITGSVDGERFGPIDFELNKLEDLITTSAEGEEIINLDPIHFEYDKWDITPQAEAVLAKALETMELFPEMVIKIESHTDSRGSDSYNMTLSDRRAKATRDYLYSKGIDEDRIVSATGFGESRLLNHCDNNATCSEEEHETNRRSDFVILER